MKVNVYTPKSILVGYFVDPKIESFPDGDYEISGEFHTAEGDKATKVEFNPQALTYNVDLSEAGLAQKKLHRVYVQRGRQPVVMTGHATA